MPITRRVERPLPFTRIVRCDDCTWSVPVSTYEADEALMNSGRCPCCKSVDLTSRPADMDARFMARSAMRADA